MKKTKSRLVMIYGLLSIIALLIVSTLAYMNLPKFGRAAQGERLRRIEQSPNYREGEFKNEEPTPLMASGKSRVEGMAEFLFEKRVRNRPATPLPAMKTDLKALSPDDDLMVWFGHSSYFLQCAGVRIAVDPVFADASPLSWFNKPFQGTDLYTVDDLPDLDYLIITHDHWDHLDHQTVSALKQRVKKAVCPLGVGQHLEYWGYPSDKIVEMDWNEQWAGHNGLTIDCLPSRHFSGRTFKSNQTLWASYMVQTSQRTIYLSGDGGYGKHFRDIADRFPHIDLAILENGQYNENWRYIHLMPDDLRKVIEELKPRSVFAGHNSKYALAKHPWDEPLNVAASIGKAITPEIGEVVRLSSPSQTFAPWWKGIE